MPTPYESADLILRLYDLRREAVMRQARDWLVTFIPETMEDVEKTMMGENSAYLRMVMSYWEMAATLVVNDAIDPKMFAESTAGEGIGVFAKLQPFVADIRSKWGPQFMQNLEKVALQNATNERLAEMREFYKTIRDLRTKAKSA